MSSTPKVKFPLLQAISYLAAFGSVASLSAVFSGHHLLFDLISHFRVQYIVLLVPALIIAVYARKTISLLLISLALAVHGYAVGFSMLPLSADVGDRADFVELKVLSANLLRANTNYDAQLEFIDSVEPDILAFQEYTHAWHQVLSTQLTDYPHRALQPTHDSFGIAIYSKFPIVEGGVENLSASTSIVANVNIDLGDKLVRVVAVHPPPPVNVARYNSRNELMQLLAEKAANHEGAMIVVGDFNASPWTSHYTKMVSTGKLRNARAGHGLNPTWPTMIFPFLIPIDHILVSSQIGVAQFEVKRVVGSDHRNIWSQLRVY